MTDTTLPYPIDAFFDAADRADLEGLWACFSEDALVNDQLRDFWGRAAIRAWIESEVVGERLRFLITERREHHGEIIITAEVDGDFDKTGLPQPMTVTLHFTLRDAAIVRLIILANPAGDATPLIRQPT